MGGHGHAFPAAAQRVIEHLDVGEVLVNAFAAAKGGSRSWETPRNSGHIASAAYDMFWYTGLDGHAREDQG